MPSERQKPSTTRSAAAADFNPEKVHGVFARKKDAVILFTPPVLTSLAVRKSSGLRRLTGFVKSDT